eukprot:1736549-Pyramimonas_sp.AAC.3
MERCPHRTVAWACSLRDHEHVYPASASIAFSNMPTSRGVSPGVSGSIGMQQTAVLQTVVREAQ